MLYSELPPLVYTVTVSVVEDELPAGGQKGKPAIAAENKYEQQLVKAISSQPGKVVTIAALGNLVTHPATVEANLSTFLKERPAKFWVDGQSVGLKSDYVTCEWRIGTWAPCIREVRFLPGSSTIPCR